MIPVLAHAPGQPGDAQSGTGSRPCAPATPSLELLPSLDDLRERITLHLSAARPGQVPALVSDIAGAAAAVAEPRRGRGGACCPTIRACGTRRSW